jgi:hypothetical protein
MPKGNTGYDGANTIGVTTKKVQRTAKNVPGANHDFCKYFMRAVNPIRIEMGKTKEIFI